MREFFLCTGIVLVLIFHVFTAGIFIRMHERYLDKQWQKEINKKPIKYNYNGKNSSTIRK